VGKIFWKVNEYADEGSEQRVLTNAEDNDGEAELRPRLADVINLFACIWQNGMESDISLPTTTMPIAPIVGKLRKRFFIDMTCALGLGISAGYAYWSVCLLFVVFYR